MNFSTKAKNLLYLKTLNLRKSKIPKFYKFTIEEIFRNKKLLINFLTKNLSKKISIRSSFLLEDGKNSSMAGEFEGLADVNNNKKNLNKGISKLLKQYKKKTRAKKIINNSEILFQNHVTNSILSGVVTNYSINDGSEYYVINYDDSSNLTNTVTSGNKTGGRVINIYKHKFLGLRSKKFKKIVISIKEIEKKIGKNVKLDVEFALDKVGKLNIFQIRPITTTQNWKLFERKVFFENLCKNQKKFNKIDKKNKKFGHFPLFGLMPDWNPAEMIGYQPNNLAYSIYKTLITDKSWSKARHEMGYKLVTHPLMYRFTGKPYIDTRLSFYSFIPKETKKITCKKLVNFWSKNLIKKPYLHDKIEFDIADGSFDAFTKKKVKKSYGFLNITEKKKYLENLKNFTEDKIINFEENFSKLNIKLSKLEDYRVSLVKKIKSKDIKYAINELPKIISLIKSNGIIPFSIYARYAFIAKKKLNSLKSSKIININSYLKILNSIDSITNDYLKLHRRSLISSKNKKNFIRHFYHLRPGTYNICVERYRNKIDTYTLPNINNILSKKVNIPILSKSDNINIKNYIKENNFKFNAEKLIKFCITAIKLRENSKFIFTRALSDVLEIIKKYAIYLNITIDEISKFNLNEILQLNFSNKKKLLNKIKNRDKKFRYINKISKLPYLITNKDDFFIASLLLTKPNFITNKIVESKIIQLKDGTKKQPINNSIVLIENADPGFDWVFSHNIKGLITKYGGVNSHMSIRCEELNIPAVIGLGNENYDKIKDRNMVILNCKNNQLSVK